MRYVFIAIRHSYWYTKIRPNQVIKRYLYILFMTIMSDKNEVFKKIDGFLFDFIICSYSR